MLLAVYRKDGNISSINKLAEDKAIDWPEKIERYNVAKENVEVGSSVELFSCTDDSVTAYLFNDKMMAKKHFREELLDIASYMSSIESSFNWLEDELEKMED